jgi:hypothetical protein
VNNPCEIPFALTSVIGLMNGSSPVIVNNIFAKNPCRAIDMTVPTEASPVIANNTIVRTWR